jgi:hypothetical protein
MRILHIDTGREMRGGQWQALLLARHLRTAGMECAFACRPGSLLDAECRREGLPVFEATLAGVRARSRDYDLVHCHDARGHTLAAVASHPPFVVSRRVAFPVKSGWLSRWKYRRAARYLAVSRFVAAELAKAGVEDARIDVVPDAVPLPAAVSDLNGPLLAIESDDPGKGAALLRRSAIEVRFTRDILADLPHARGFLYISSMEGLGSAALLAMAWGVPVIASRVGGLPEIVLDGETGLLVDNEPAAIARAAARLLEDRGLAARLGKRGRQLVEQGFTLETMVEKTVAAYSRVLA